jgi:hypothetical protein
MQDPSPLPVLDATCDDLHEVMRRTRMIYVTLDERIAVAHSSVVLQPLPCLHNVYTTLTRTAVRLKL